jgi:hypothetical protein
MNNLGLLEELLFKAGIAEPLSRPVILFPAENDKLFVHLLGINP